MNTISGPAEKFKNDFSFLGRIGLILVFLIFTGNAIVLFILPLEEFTLRIFLSNSLSSILIGGSLAIGIGRIMNWLDKKHPWLKDPVKRLVLQLITTIGYSLIIIGIATLALVFIDRDSIPSDVIFESGMFMIKIAIPGLVIMMLVVNAIFFFINWKRSVIIQEELKREQLSMQYETLKSQVNPHFLFNNLNSLTSLIRKDPDNAILFVKKLSEVFRYVLEQKDNEITSVESEVNFLESYIYLQKIRFGENLTVNVDVKERNRFIIPLALQMLIENAIKHNVISKEFPLTISILSKNENYITVTNNLKRKPAINTGSIGLENIRSRFRFFTSDPVIVREDESAFSVDIPVIERMD
jgi:hypothetical protein